MFNNSWLKLAAVSLAGIVVSFGILWGINSFSNTNMNNMNMGTGYQNTQTYGATENGYNMQGSMNMQGNMNGNMQSGGMMDDMMGGMM